jgi:hypothetical protein
MKQRPQPIGVFTIGYFGGKTARSPRQPRHYIKGSEMKHASMLVEEIIRIAELENAKELAEELGCHPAIITRIRQGKRPFTPFQAKAIEVMTKGKVSRELIRPDVFL